MKVEIGVKVGVAFRLARDLVLMGCPLPLIWWAETPLANGVTWVVYVGLALYLVSIEESGMSRVGIFLAATTAGIFFELLPEGEIWSYLAAGGTVLFLLGAYREAIACALARNYSATHAREGTDR